MSGTQWELAITEGDTFAVRFVLLDDGVILPGSGKNIDVVLKDKDETDVTGVTAVGWDTELLSIGTFRLPATGLLNSLSPYYAHWVVTSGPDEISYPTPALRITVLKR